MSDAMVIERLDMSLDEIAAQRRKSGKPFNKLIKAGFKRRSDGPVSRLSSGKGAGKRPINKSPKITVTVQQSAEGRRGFNKFSDAKRKDPDKEWEHDLYLEQYPDIRKQNKAVSNALSSFASKSIGMSLSTTGTVTISNIPWQVEASDLQELFRNFHDYSKAEIVFDRSGRPTGAALIHFHKRVAARKFVEQYDGVKLDGQVMKVVEGDQSREFSGEHQEDAFSKKTNTTLKPRGRGNAKFQPSQRKIVRMGE